MSFQRCVKGIPTIQPSLTGYRLMIKCHDGHTRVINPSPQHCEAKSTLRSVARGFCENRCNPEILTCPEIPILNLLIDNICEKVHECRPNISEEDCTEAIENISISDELGLSEGNNNITIAVIRQALLDGAVSFDETVNCDCLYRINNLSCSAFGSSYVTTLEELWELEEVIPEECGNDLYPGVFIPKNFNPITGQTEN